MKKILWLTFIFTLLFVSRGFAAYSFTAPKPVDNTITATLTGALNNHKYKLVLQTENFTSDTYTGKLPSAFDLPSTTGTVSWTIKGNKANTVYYVRVLDIPPGINPKPVYITDTVSITTGAVNIPLIPLTTSKDGDDIIISGKIDGAKIPGFEPTGYRAELYYTKVVPGTGATTLTGGTGPLASKTTSAIDGPTGINADGTYFWHLTSLSPSTTYYVQQTVYLNSNSKVDTIANFNSSTGNIITSAVDQANYNAEHSYTLLSGFPNFTVLPDPDLCAQQRASGLNPQFCDMNDVLNYFLKLLIGLSAVVLVFRLMYEGYTYMTTDVPFLKASSKGSFFAALGGLLLALSSYIILNTINPKLVSNTVGLNQLSIGITQTSLDSATFQSVTGERLKTKSEYIPIVDTIARQEGVDACIVKATIQVESDWNAGAIGCDEDSANDKVPSRKAFLGSGITFSGTAFTPTSNSQSSQKNGACTFKKGVAGYGLDWRFSKGGGLMQVTLFPPGYKSQAWYDGVKSGGTYWNSRNTPYAGWQTLIRPESNISQGSKMLKQNLADCKGNVEQAFRAYQSGSCTGSGRLIDATVSKKLSIYNSCKSGNTI